MGSGGLLHSPGHGLRVHQLLAEGDDDRDDDLPAGHLQRVPLPLPPGDEAQPGADLAHRLDQESESDVCVLDVSCVIIVVIS